MEPTIRIVVLNGSVRPGNYTQMASALVVDELRKDPRVSGVHPGDPRRGGDGVAVVDLT